MKHTLSLGLLAIACAPSLHAEPTSKLEELVITSSRVEMPLRQIGTSVSVITADDIEAYGYNSMSDILRTSPGVAVSSNGGAGSPTALRIRGEEGYRTRVYVDGMNISDASGTQFSPNIEHMLSSGVERVEILRGPQGLMYGADAGGIVDIRTRSFEDGFGGDVSAEGGRYGFRKRDTASRTHRDEVEIGGSPAQYRIPDRSAHGVGLQLQLIGYRTDALENGFVREGHIGHDHAASAAKSVVVKLIRCLRCQRQPSSTLQVLFLSPPP